mmetsp:Transcript_38854/g.91988  ORF Transcript_38854/g.91988 Transcript_38854/m.91988 type:complete len:278 (-) Transcript_38854:2433-3266(-)
MAELSGTCSSRVLSSLPARFMRNLNDTALSASSWPAPCFPEAFAESTGGGAAAAAGAPRMPVISCMTALNCASKSSSSSCSTTGRLTLTSSLSSSFMRMAPSLQLPSVSSSIDSAGGCPDRSLPAPPLSSLSAALLALSLRSSSPCASAAPALSSSAPEAAPPCAPCRASVASSSVENRLMRGRRLDRRSSTSYSTSRGSGASHRQKCWKSTRNWSRRRLEGPRSKYCPQALRSVHTRRIRNSACSSTASPAWPAPSSTKETIRCSVSKMTRLLTRR